MDSLRWRFRLLLLGTGVLTAILVGVRAMPLVDALVEERDLTPDCMVDRGDKMIVSARCRPHDVSYYFTKEFIPNQTKRVAFNNVLKGLLFGGFYRTTDTGATELDAKALLHYLPTRADQEEFIRALYAVKDSVVWANGHTFAVYEILGMDIFQPLGRHLENKALSDLAAKCDVARLGELQVADLVLHVAAEMKETFEAISRCACHADTVSLLLLTSVGFARLGDSEASQKVLSHLEEFAKETRNGELESTIRTTRQGLGTLPSEERELRKLLAEWFELPL